MKFFLKFWIVIQILGLSIEICCCSLQAFFHREEGKYLANNVIRMEQTGSELECGGLCSRESSCVSVNYKNSGENQGMCELNNKALEDSEENERAMPEFTNLGIILRSCELKDQIFSPKTKQCVTFVGNSCKDLVEKNGSLPDGVYNIQDTSLKHYPVYCHMTDIRGCGEGAWTLVMKTDGSEYTFGYNSAYWSDKKTYGVQEGLEGLTDKETKLESYWNTPFTKICLEMKVSGVTKWIKLDYEATSLYSVIADGTFRPTAAGRKSWKSLISGSSLQYNCNKEGFNFQNGLNFIRLGLLGNEGNDCNSCNSWIGFGYAIYWQGTWHSTATTGNFASHGGDKGDKNMRAIGYVLVS